MTENVAFFLALAVMLIIGICIGCYIGSRIAKPNVSQLADEHYPYHDIWHRIETTDLFTYDEKLLLGVMIEDFVKENL